MNKLKFVPRYDRYEIQKLNAEACYEDTDEYIIIDAKTGDYIYVEGGVRYPMDTIDIDTLKLWSEYTRDSDFMIGPAFKFAFEYIMRHANTEGITKPIIDRMEVLYDQVLKSCILYRYRNKPSDVAVKVYDSIIKWLKASDFYTAPASTRFHESCPSGLLYHTLKVVYHIRELTQLEPFHNVDLHEAMFVALVHDWCKIGLYEPYQRNVKNEQTGQWESVTAYRFREQKEPFGFGHGTTSMWLVSQFVRLNLQESLAIRWHMGEYNVADNEMNDLHAANERYPLVFLLQFADRLAITCYNTDNESR